MQVTQANVQDFLVAASDVRENLELAEEAAEAWQSAKEDGEDAEAIREARESLDEALESLDIATLCQLIHGKHKGK